MRTSAWLVVFLALPGCYLFHGAPDGDAGVPAPTLDASLPVDPPITPRDAGRDGGGPPVIRPPGMRADAGRPPTFVPDGSVLRVERPNEAITCDDGDEVLVSLCGALPILHLATDGRAGGTGTAADPFGAFDAAIAACGAGCQLRVEQGELPVARTLLPAGSCVSISGGWARAGDAWTATDGRTVLRGPPIVGVFLETPWRLLVERVSIVGTNTGIGAEAPSDLLVVRDSDLDVSGVGIWSMGRRSDRDPTATGARICRTRILSGMHGITFGQETSDAIVEDVEIDAGLDSGGDGVSIDSRSSRILVRGATIRAGRAGVDVGDASHVAIEESDLDGRYAGVVISWSASHVLVSRSTALGCTQPVFANGSWIQLVDTITGECTHGDE